MISFILDSQDAESPALNARINHMAEGKYLEVKQVMRKLETPNLQFQEKIVPGFSQMSQMNPGQDSPPMMFWVIFSKGNQRILVFSLLRFSSAEFDGAK